jgi:hypothetical protein
MARELPPTVQQVQAEQVPPTTYDYSTDIGTQAERMLGHGLETQDIAIPPFQVDPELRGDKYDTPLTDKQYEDYKEWARKSGRDPAFEERDYDLRGFFLTHPEPLKPGEHGKDTFKKPWHPTFSDESKYSTGENQGGHWTQKGKDWYFAPGPANWRFRTLRQMQHYFDTQETPDTHLTPLPEGP